MYAPPHGTEPPGLSFGEHGCVRRSGARSIGFADALFTPSPKRARVATPAETTARNAARRRFIVSVLKVLTESPIAGAETTARNTTANRASSSTANERRAGCP